MEHSSTSPMTDRSHHAALVAEPSEILGISHNTLYRLIWRRELSRVHLGRRALASAHPAVCVAAPRGDGAPDVTVFPQCRSRTCPVCWEWIEDRGVPRVTWAFNAVEMRIADAPTDDWCNLATRALQHGAVAAKMLTNLHHDQVVVLSSEPPTGAVLDVTDDAREAQIHHLVEHRPPRTPAPSRGQEQRVRRPYVSGVGLPSVKEWEAMNGHARTEPDRESVCARMHPSTVGSMTTARRRSGRD